MGPVEAAVRVDLAERVRSALGQAALVLARHLDEAGEAAAATQAARELRLLLTEIWRTSAPAARGEIDDLRARRAERERAASR